MSKEKKRYPYRKRRRQSSLWWMVGLGVGVTALLIGLSIWSTGRPGDLKMPESIKTDQELLATRGLRGKADAPVELVEYSDYRCPACATANAALGPQLDQLVQAGTVKVSHKHLLVIGDKVNSQNAAEAVECAADQGYYWAFHELLFANQVKGQNWSRAMMKSYAKALKLDTGAFGQCMDSKKYAAKVQADGDEARAVPGITGTPSFLVNGELLQLRQSFNEVIDAIKAAAK